MQKQQQPHSPQAPQITSPPPTLSLPFQCQYYYLKGLTTFTGQHLMKMQTSHIMVLFFFVGGLHILEKEQLLDTNGMREKLINYVLGLGLKNGGFCSAGLYKQVQSHEFGHGHIVFAYSALNCLQILGALDKVDKQAVLACIGRHQKQDGSFSSFPNSTQSDLRFVYSALSICSMLQTTKTINLQKTKQYIDSCYNFDGGYGLRPKDESHCGAIYCAIASYQHLNVEIPVGRKMRTVHFLVNRQVIEQGVEGVEQGVEGVQGRVGKSADSCYSFGLGRRCGC